MKRQSRRGALEFPWGGMITPPIQMETWTDQHKFRYLLNSITHFRRIWDDNILDISLHYLPLAARKEILRLVKSWATKAVPECKGHFKGYHSGDNGLNATLGRLFDVAKVKPKVEVLIMAALRELEDAAGPAKDDPLKSRVEEVARIFSLSEVEREILLIAYMIYHDRDMDRICDAVVQELKLKVSSDSRCLAVMTGLSRHDIARAQSLGSTLSKTGLVQADMIAKELAAYLDGLNDSPISKTYFSEFEGESLPLDYHTIEARHLNTVLDMARDMEADKQGLHILLYGEPGTGKTEFARSLARELGKKVYEIRENEEDTEKNRSAQAQFRLRAILAVQKMVDPSRSLIIVDEADALINSRPLWMFDEPPVEKGHINKVLDNAAGIFIWITNQRGGVDSSTARRFDYSIEFPKMTYRQRLKVWECAVKKYGLEGEITLPELEAWAARWEISAGGVNLALKNAARRLRAGAPAPEFRGTIEAVVAAHRRFLDPNGSGGDNREASAPVYSIEGLNVKGRLDRSLVVLDRFNSSWNAEAPVTGLNRNMNVLLYGPPGTGKTEFAKYLARRLNRRLVEKKASDLLGMYVGQTEQQIRQAFREAEQERAILFFDEADSLLGAREGAQHSWEVTQVNEMLTHMETFRGIVICSTNFKKMVDNAASRRFAIKLEFDYLLPEGNREFYGRFFGAMVAGSLSREQEKAVEGLSNTTPGDFKAVLQRFALLEEGEISHEVIIEGLREEVRAKNGVRGERMGF